MTHRIRLRGFWTSTPLADGRVRHVRKFGRPRTLDANEVLWVVTAVPGIVSVNGTTIGHGTELPIPFELPPRNELAIECDGALGDVALEVRASGGA